MMYFGAPSFGRGVLYIGTAATAWGTGGVVAAVLYASGGFGSLAVSFWRFLGGALLLGLAWPVLRGPGSPLRQRFSAAPGRLLVTGVGMAGYQTAYYASIAHTGVAVATVVTLGSGPVLIALGARLWLAERLGRAGVAMVAAAVLGLALLVLGDGTGSVAAPGIGLALLSGLGYAGTTLLNRAMGTAADGGGNPAGNALIGFAVGAVCLLPLALAEGLLPAAADPVVTGALLGYLGLVPSALAYALFFAGLTTVKATTAAVVALVEPLTAAAIGVLWLGERMTAPAVAGAVMLLCAVCALVRWPYS